MMSVHLHTLHFSLFVFISQKESGIHPNKYRAKIMPQCTRHRRQNWLDRPDQAPAEAREVYAPGRAGLCTPEQHSQEYPPRMARRHLLRPGGDPCLSEKAGNYTGAGLCGPTSLFPDNQLAASSDGRLRMERGGRKGA